MIHSDKFKELKRFLNSTKPIYIYGKSGVGKTEMIKTLNNIQFISIQDINEYDDILPFMKPSIIDLFNKKDSSKICVIDNIDFLHTHEKKVLTSFLKQFKLEEKRKKTRDFSIILCGTNIHDKKIKDKIEYTKDELKENKSHHVGKIKDKLYSASKMIGKNKKKLQVKDSEQKTEK